MKRKPALLLALSLYSVPPSVLALGLGDIELRSSLNQPLDARIALKSWQPGELDGLEVSLAGREHFMRAGLERLPSLSALQFNVVEAPDGSAYVEVSTKSDLREPFLDFLIEVSWPQGRVLREYTLLLDPPLYAAAVAQSLKRPLATEAASGSAGKPADQARKPIEHSADTLANASPSNSPRGRAQSAHQRQSPALPPAASAPQQEIARSLTYGPTATGDTLWQVASEVVGASSDDLNQLMLALFRANPDAFLEGNMNLLKKGVVLQIPDSAAVSAIQASEALDEVRRHHALWEEYRQVVAGGTDKLPSGAVAEGNSPAKPQESQQTAASSERVRLVSAGSASTGSGVGADENDSAEKLRNELTLVTEEAEATKRENQDLRERLGEAETIVEDLRRLIDLKDDTISSLQQQIASADIDAQPMGTESPEALMAPPGDEVGTQTTSAAESPDSTKRSEGVGTDAASDTFTQDQVVAATQTAQPQDVGAEQAQEVQSRPAAKQGALGDDSAPAEFVSETASSHSLTAIGVGLLGSILVAVGGLAMWRRRRARKVEPPTADSALLEGDGVPDSVSASVAADAEDSEALEVSAAESEVGAPEVDVELAEVGGLAEVGHLDEDPLAEVNVYLAYERFEQAERLVKQAIEDYPSRQEYKLKLLEIFAASKDDRAFKIHARALRDAVGDESPLMEKARAWWAELCPEQELFEDTGESDAFSFEDGKAEEADLSAAISPDFAEEEDASLAADTVHLKPGERLAREGHLGSNMELDFDLGSDLVSDERARERTEGTVDFDLGLEGVATGDASHQEGGLDLAFGDTAPDEQANAGAHQTGMVLDFTLDDTAADASNAAEGTIDFDLSDLKAGASPASTASAADEEAGPDETVDLDYSFAEEPLEVPERDPDALGFVKNPEEGTVDFDLGLADGAKNQQATPPEVTAFTADSALDLREARGEDGIEQTLDADSQTGASATDELMVVQDSTEDENSLLGEHSGAPELVDATANPRAAENIDLEIEPEEPTEALREGDVAPKYADDGGKAMDAVPPQSQAEDAVLDEWAELEGESGDDVDRTLVLGREFSQDLDEIQTKLELAQAYMDMGDVEGARSILDEVMSEGDSEQKQAAKELLAKIA